MNLNHTTQCGARPRQFNRTTHEGTFAAELADEGVLRIVSRALGHSNVAITDRYIQHLNPTAVIDYMAQRAA